MTDRYIRLNVLSSGTEKAKASLDDIAARAKALDDLNPEIKPSVNDTAAQARLKDLKLKIQILNDERAEVAFETKGDEKVKATLLDLKGRLRELGDTVSKPEVKLQDADKIEAQLIKIKLLMDSIHNKKVDLNLAEKSSDSGSWLARLSRGANKGILGIPKDSGSGGAGGENAAAGLLNGSPGAFLTNPLVAGPLGSLVASLLPSVVGLGVGGGVGLGGIGLSALGASQSAAKVKAQQAIVAELQKDLTSKSTPKGDLPGVRSNLASAQKLLGADNRQAAPFLAMTSDAKNLLTPLLGIITPFTRALDPILKQLDKFEIAIGPSLSKMFMASLPFVKQFLGVMEQGGKTLIPAFTEAMNTMVKSGALSEMMQAFVLLIKDGLVPFLRLLGPGMKSSATVFKAVILALDGVLIGLAVAATFIAREMAMMGHAITDVGKVFYDIGRVIAALLTGNWKAMGDAVKALGNNFRNFFATMASMLTDGYGRLSNFGHMIADTFDKLRHNTASVFEGIKHDVDARWDATWGWAETRLSKYGSYVAGQYRNVWDQSTKWFDRIRHDISAIWDVMWRDVLSRAIQGIAQNLGITKGFEHDIANLFDNLRHMVADIWDQTWHDIDSRASSGMANALGELKQWNHNITSNFDTLRHGIAHIWSLMWSEVRSNTVAGVHAVSNAIHGIENAFRTPVAFVVNDVWDRLAGIWNRITGIVHLSNLKLPIAHFADGGRVTQGTGPRSDDVLARVSKGETVVSAAHSNMLSPIFSAVGIPGYAAGGIPNPIKAVGGFFSGLGHDVLGLLAKPANFIMSKFFGGVEGMLGHIPGVSPAMDQVLSGLTKSLLSTLVGKAHNAGQAQFSTGKFTGHVGAGVQQWRGTVMKALGLEGLPLGLTNQVLFQMMTESGGNPNAINLTDSNAAAGDPSRGLLQTIMSTFRAYHWPGTSGDIYNPLANVAAAINYARHVYGPSLMRGGMGLGSGHGYLHGGWINEPVIGRGLKSGQSYSFAENGLPEYVSPHGAVSGHGGGGNIYITVQGDTDPDAAARRIHQKLRRYKTKRGGKALGLA